MAEKIKLVQGDTRPALVCTITDELANGPVGLAGASVSLKIRAAGDTALRTTVNGIVTDPANGVVLFSWATAPSALTGDAGDYEGEIEITFSNGEIQTVYDLLKFKLREDF
jgi:hypothetical protein